VVSEWFWFYWHRGDQTKWTDREVTRYMRDHFPPDWTYQQFGPQFTAEFFNATAWAELVAASGAKYFVLTSKHHDGFANWRSKHNFGWNAADIGPKRDLVAELAAAFRQQSKVVFGLYHSMFEWFNPLYLQDERSNFTSREFVTSKVMPELMDLVTTYRPEVLWSDGAQGAVPEYWGSQQFLAWLYNDSPVRDRVVTNDRWGKGVMCKHGDFYTCSDRYNPGVLQAHKWENAMTVDKRSWGFRRNMQLDEILTAEELVRELVTTVSCGGNLLVNIGPDSAGQIAPVFQERLQQLGAWLAWHGEAIYSSQPWAAQQDSANKQVWYTAGRPDPSQAATTVFAILLAWPSSQVLELGSPVAGPHTRVQLLGGAGLLHWEARPAGGLRVSLPHTRPGPGLAWVIRMDGLENGGNSV